MGASRYGPINVYWIQNDGFPCAENGIENNAFHESGSFVVLADISGR